MPERGSKGDHHLDPIERAQTSVEFWVRGKKEEINRELEDLKKLSKGTQAHKGRIVRPELEIEHLQDRLGDYEEARKLFVEILESLKSSIEPEQPEFKK